MSNFIAVLTVYRRPHLLQEQINCILNQTVLPQEIWIWQNYYPNIQRPAVSTNNIPLRTFQCNSNMKYCGRFAVSLLAFTDYVAIFDDDTMPGRKWFANCLECMENEEAIYGSAGVILQTPYSYEPHTRVGWPAPNESMREVDLVGHAWFVPYKALSAMFRERPMLENGEDIHLSAMAQIHLGMKTYVPPHPPSDKDYWGSTKGNQYGIDAVASSAVHNHGVFYRQRDACIQRCIKFGWRPLCFV